MPTRATRASYYRKTGFKHPESSSSHFSAGLCEKKQALTTLESKNYLLVCLHMCTKCGTFE